MYLTSDHYLNDMPLDVPRFAQGKTWLVEARRSKPDRPWITSTCQRNKSVESAAEELATLRAWLSGQHLPGQITGEIWDPVQRKSVSGIQVDLVGGAEPLFAVSDERGQFAFHDLPAGKYEATALLPQVCSGVTWISRAPGTRVVFISKEATTPAKSRDLRGGQFTVEADGGVRLGVDSNTGSLPQA